MGVPTGQQSQTTGARGGRPTGGLLGAFLVVVVLLTGCWQPVSHYTIEIELQSGMNTVVYPGQTMNIEDATASIRTDLESVSYWNGSAWLVYTPSPAYDDLNTLVKGQTYNVYMKAGATWSVPER